MSYSPGPGSRVPIPKSRLRFARRRAARRRGFAVFLGVLVVAIAIGAIALGGGGDDAGGPGRPTGAPSGNGHQGDGNGDGGGTIDLANAPIDHVVFIVKENRTFNNYFATYPGAEGSTTGGTIKCTDSGCEDGPTVKLTHGPDVYEHDMTHCFRCGLTAINDGKMNGFNHMNGVIPQTENADIFGADLQGYSYLDRSDLPNYWAYADRFVLADHFFTAMYGPTTPEHLYAVAAQSNYIVDNKSTTDTPGSYCDDNTEYATRFIPREARQNADHILDLEKNINANGSNAYDIGDYWGNVRLCFDIDVLPDQLEANHIDWKYYAEDNAWMNVLQMIRHVRFGPMWDKVQPPSSFVQDVRSGNMPAVSWIIPPESYNEHPGGGKSSCAGENWTVQQVNTVMKSPYWRSTAFIIVWDDFGGFYDPVAPPQYDIMGLGPRTPALIISPYTASGDNPDGGTVDPTTYEPDSVLAFIEQRFGLKPMTDRDAQADPLTGAFDWDHPDFKKMVLPLRDDCPYGNTIAEFSGAQSRTIGNPFD